MFVRMLTVHCDQNDSYEIAINGFQVRKTNEIRNVIFRSPAMGNLPQRLGQSWGVLDYLMNIPTQGTNSILTNISK